MAVTPAVSQQPRAGGGWEKSALEGCGDWLADEQSLAKCWPRAEEEVKPCTSICKGVNAKRGRRMVSFQALVQLCTPEVKRKKRS